MEVTFMDKGVLVRGVKGQEIIVLSYFEWNIMEL